MPLQLNNAYEECARDKLCDRTTTCRKVRCQSLTDRMKVSGLNQSCRNDGTGLLLLFIDNKIKGGEEHDYKKDVR